MKKGFVGYLTLGAILVFAACTTIGNQSGGGSAPSASVSSGSGVTITTPGSATSHRGAVKVCMSTSGYTVEPAKKGVTAGHGHHHILVDVLPSQIDFSKPLAKDASHVHMGDGSSCKTLTLSPGQHTLTAQFARGNHVPYKGVHHTISIRVKGTYN